VKVSGKLDFFNRAQRELCSVCSVARAADFSGCLDLTLHGKMTTNPQNGSAISFDKLISALYLQTSNVNFDSTFLCVTFCGSFFSFCLFFAICVVILAFIAVVLLTGRHEKRTSHRDIR